MLKKLFVVIVLLLSELVLFAGNPFLLYFETINSTSSYVDIEVKVKDFNDINGAQMFLTWDSIVYHFDNLSNLNPALKNFEHNSNISHAKKNNFGALWFNTSAITLSDESSLFTIRLSTSGSPCDSTALRLIDYSPNRQSLASYEINGESYESKIRFEESNLIIPGEDCEITNVFETSKNTKINNIYLYPNPTKSVVNLNLEGNIMGEYNIEFLTPLGKIIFKDRFSKSSATLTYSYDLGANLKSKLLFIKLTDRFNTVSVYKVILRQ